MKYTLRQILVMLWFNPTFDTYTRLFLGIMVMGIITALSYSYIYERIQKN